MAKAGDRLYREIFFAHNGPGPYICKECEGEVTFFEVLVHHEDHDRSNNNLENLVPNHRGCHTIHHSTGRGLGKKASEETKAKMRESGLKRWATVSEEDRKEHGQISQKGRNDDVSETLKKNWETRRKLYGPSGHKKKQ